MVTLQQYYEMTPRQQVKGDKLDLQMGELCPRALAPKNVDINNSNNSRVIDENGNVPSNADIMRELLNIRKDINELKETIKVMNEALNTAYESINKQMRFIEMMDKKERGRNMMISGIKEDVGVHPKRTGLFEGLFDSLSGI